MIDCNYDELVQDKIQACQKLADLSLYNNDLNSIGHLTLLKNI